MSETRMNKKSWYNEVSLGVRKVMKIGGSLGISIPIETIRKYNLKDGDKFVVLLLQRVRTLADEITPEDEKDYVQYRKWKQDNDSKISEDVKKLREQTKKVQK